MGLVSYDYGGEGVCSKRDQLMKVYQCMRKMGLIVGWFGSVFEEKGSGPFRYICCTLDCSQG